MKKTYIHPRIKMLVAGAADALLAASGVTDTDKGIGYGGIDTGGEKDPSAKPDVWNADGQVPSVWDE